MEIEFFEKISLFKDLPKEAIEKIMSLLETRNYDRGDLIVKEGAMGEALHIVLSGKVSVSKVIGDNIEAGERILTFLKPGDFFGETSIVQATETSANVKSSDKSVIALLHTRDFESFAAGNMNASFILLKNIIANLMRRMRLLNQQMISSLLWGGGNLEIQE